MQRNKKSTCIKCGPSSDPKEIVKLTEVLNPDNEAGRITLIARFGHDQVTKFLPKLIKEIKKAGRNVVGLVTQCMEIQ